MPPSLRPCWLNHNAACKKLQMHTLAVQLAAMWQKFIERARLAQRIMTYCNCATPHFICMDNAEEYWITARCVTRSDGARGKKQVWRPHVRTWGLSEANVLHWSTCDIARTFRRPGNCAPCPGRSARDYCAQRRASTKPWYTAPTRGIREPWASGGNFSICPNFCVSLRKTNRKVLQGDSSA